MPSLITTHLPYTTLFRSVEWRDWQQVEDHQDEVDVDEQQEDQEHQLRDLRLELRVREDVAERQRHGCKSEEHTSEIQSPCNLVFRLLLEKKIQSQTTITH